MTSRPTRERRCICPPLSRQIPIPTLISPAMDGFLTTLASAAQIWPAGLYRESTCVSPRGRLNRRRTLIWCNRAACILDTMALVYMTSIGYTMGGCMYAAPWFRGTVWGVNEAPAAHMAPPVTRVTSAPETQQPLATQSVVSPKSFPLFIILEALVS